MSNLALRFVANVINPDHNATPIVVGDVSTIARWTDDGSDEVGLVELDGGGEAFLPDLELRAPGVFVGDGEVWLVAEGNTNKELSAWLDVEAAGPLLSALPWRDEEEEGELEVPTGKLAIALAYEAPELPKTMPKAAKKVSDTLTIVPFGGTKAAVTTALTTTNDLPFKKRSILPIEGDETPILIRYRFRPMK